MSSSGQFSAFLLHSSFAVRHDGQPTSIDVSPDGRNVTIINEQGQRASGYMSGNHELVISSLGIRGHVGHGGRRISWANGHRVDPLIEDRAMNRTIRSKRTST